MSAVVGALRVSLNIDTAAFDRGLGTAQKGLAGAGAKFEQVGSKLAGVGAKMTVGITGPLAALAASSSKAATESAQAMGQVNAALASMGAASGRTSEQLAALAEKQMKLSTFDDDEILVKSTANLLTFGNIAGEAFDRAQMAALDLATRMGGDLQGATMMIGKALNDPVAGLGKLSKAGIQFTEDQKAQIAAMAASGDAAGAQAIMLAELERQFGGSAKAMRDATPGVDAKQAWGSFQETIGAIVNKVLPPLTALLTRVLDGFNNLSPGMQSTVIGFAAAAAAIGPFTGAIGLALTGVGKVLPLFMKLGPAFTIVKAGFAAMKLAAVTSLPALVPFLVPLGAIALAAGGAYLAFKNWDKITAFVGNMVKGVTGWLKDKLGPIMDWVGDKIKWVADKFKWLDNVVVRNSYIPDMVTSVGAWMGKLPDLMAGPTNAATSATADAFASLQDNLSGMTIEPPGIGDVPDAATDAIGGSPAPGGASADSPATGLLGSLQRIQTGLQGVGDAGRSAFTDVADSILSTAIPALEAMRSATASLGDKIGLIGNALSSLFGAVFGKKFGRVVGAIGQAGASIATAFGGARAMGGPVAAGKSYLVGERGPEMIVPNRAGFVMPNIGRMTMPSRPNLSMPNFLGGANDRGSSQNITVNVNAKDAVLTHTVKDWVMQGVVAATDAGSKLGSAGAQTALYRRHARTIT